jgi:hypothetical protein
MRSDYLDTSNPLRLEAFFMFCDAANMARDGAANLHIEDPRFRALTVSVLESMRQRAVQSAIDTLGGISYLVALGESS